MTEQMTEPLEDVDEPFEEPFETLYRAEQEAEANLAAAQIAVQSAKLMWERAYWCQSNGIDVTLDGSTVVADVAALTAASYDTQREAFVVLASSPTAPDSLPKGTDRGEVFDKLTRHVEFRRLLAASERPTLLDEDALTSSAVSELTNDVWDKILSPIRWALSADTRRGRAERAVDIGQQLWIVESFDRLSKRLEGVAYTRYDREGAPHPRDEFTSLLWVWANHTGDLDELTEAWAAMSYPMRMLYTTAGQRRGDDERWKLPIMLR